MRNWKRLGYISIELVITAALIMAAGFFALLNLGSTGSLLMQNGMNRLDSTGAFETEAPVGGGGTEVVYDENGYPTSLNVNLADVAPEEDFGFIWNSSLDGWAIRWYDGFETELIIPAYRGDGLPIVEFQSNALCGYSLTSLVLPNTIKSIGRYAFDSNYLTSVIIPNSVTNLSEYAFSTNALTSVVVPDSVVTMGEGVFYDNEITSFVFTKNMNIIPKYTFAENNITTLVIPQYITSVVEWAFDRNQISDLTLPSGLESIGDFAFSRNQLESVVFPDGLDSIGASAFVENPLVSLVIPSSVNYLGVGAFEMISTLSSLRFEGAKPTVGWSPPFRFSGLTTGSVSVPMSELDSYQASADELGLTASDFVGY